MKPELNTITQGDTLEVLKTWPDEFVDCVVTSPPYWQLRDYNVEGQIGLENTIEEYIEKLLFISHEIKRVLKPSGSYWVNLGDTYNGAKQGKTDKKVSDYLKSNSKGIKKMKTGLPYKTLLQIPERFSISMTDRGWCLRNTIIWHKKNAMPSSVLDRFANKYEKFFFFTKSIHSTNGSETTKNVVRYFFDLDSIRVPFETNENRPNGLTRNREYRYDSKFNMLQAENFGSPRVRISKQFNSAENTKNRELEINARKFNIRRPVGKDYQRNDKGKNPGDVWTTTSEPYPEAHFATFPTKIIVPIISACCPPKGIVCDIFMGSGTTALVARQLGRNYLGIELNSEFIKLAEKDWHKMFYFNYLWITF